MAKPCAPANGHADFLGIAVLEHGCTTAHLQHEARPTVPAKHFPCRLAEILGAGRFAATPPAAQMADIQADWAPHRTSTYINDIHHEEIAASNASLGSLSTSRRSISANMNSNTSPCSTCPYRLLGLCKALALGQERANSELAFIDARPRTPIVRTNAPLNKVMILCDGYAIQVAQLADGRRQIISLRRPGQLLMGLETFAKRSRLSAQALTSVRVGCMPKDAFGKSIAACPESFSALLKEVDQESRDHTDLLVDLGRRSAIDRLSHLICKFVDWYNVPVVDNQCAFRMLLRQEDIADFLGLTTTHVNRTIGALRRAKLIDLFEDKLKVLDFERLRMCVG